MSPNAAGALCTIIAKKIMNESEGWVEDAPRAIPSAAAWMTSPSVVESVRGGREDVGAGEEAEERSERE